jgi:hypothetical protein
MSLKQAEVVVQQYAALLRKAADLGGLPEAAEVVQLLKSGENKVCFLNYELPASATYNLRHHHIIILPHHRIIKFS